MPYLLKPRLRVSFRRKLPGWWIRGSFRGAGLEQPTFRGLLFFIYISLLASHLVGVGHAQNSAIPFGQRTAILGGTSAVPPSPTGKFGAPVTLLPSQHKNPSGKPCVSVHAVSRNQPINPTIFDHVLIIENVCSQPIKIRACYYKSTTCIDTIIAGYTRRQQTLGLAPNVKEFRYSYTENFD
jgi:hypothetical protein